MIFNIFGSSNSTDYDIFVFVDNIDSIEKNHDLIKQYNIELEKILSKNNYPTKKINANLAIVNDGVITKVFKGTADECNNSLLVTFNYHKQLFPCQVTKSVDRVSTNEFKHLKLKRCARFILSFYSRVPELRSKIKPALRGDFKLRLETLQLIDFTIHTDFPKKEESVQDIYKVIAFQLAQTYSLVLNDEELYTKNDILGYYPSLINFINRNEITKSDLKTLQAFYYMFLELCHYEMEKMDNLIEPIFV